MQHTTKRTQNSGLINRNREWTAFNTKMAAALWSKDDATTLDRHWIMKILNDLYWHGGNRSKPANLSTEERLVVERYQLCGEAESQHHSVLTCSHPIARHYGFKIRITTTLY